MEFNVLLKSICHITVAGAPHVFPGFLTLEWTQLSFNPFPHNPALNNKAFKNIEGKGENAGNQHFLLFPKLFLPIPIQIFLSYKFSSESVNCYHTAIANTYPVINRLTKICTTTITYIQLRSGNEKAIYKKNLPTCTDKKKKEPHMQILRLSCGCVTFSDRKGRDITPFMVTVYLQFLYMLPF